MFGTNAYYRPSLKAMAAEDLAIDLGAARRERPATVQLLPPRHLYIKQRGPRDGLQWEVRAGLRGWRRQLVVICAFHAEEKKASRTCLLQAFVCRLSRSWIASWLVGCLDRTDLNNVKNQTS